MNGTPLLTTEQTAQAAKEDYTEQELEAMSTEELFRLYKRTGKQEHKWPLVLRYTGLVKSIALQVLVYNLLILYH